MTGAWFFLQEAFSGDIVATEPDGTEHRVTGGDMRTTAGVRLLNAMVKALTERAPAAQQLENATA